MTSAFSSYRKEPTYRNELDFSQAVHIKNEAEIRKDTEKFYRLLNAPN